MKSLRTLPKGALQRHCCKLRSRVNRLKFPSWDAPLGRIAWNISRHCSTMATSGTVPEHPPHRLVVGGKSYLGIREGYPKAALVHSDPPIFQIENFLSDEECDALMATGLKNLKPSVVVDKSGKISMQSRTSSSCYLSKVDMKWLHERVLSLTGCPVGNQEAVQVAKYEEGQLYMAHYDAFDTTTETGRECMKTGGQRIGTVLIYLNDVKEGGATYFPKLDKRFHPKRGRAVVFFPCGLDGVLDPQALHTAEKAVDQKWVSQIWLRERFFG